MDREREPELLRPLAQRHDAGQHADGGDGDVPRPDAEAVGSLRMVSVGLTAGQFMSGSPMPMKTMFVGRSGGSSSASSRTWPAISDGARLREKPMSPVAQKEHCSAHPACDEMQNVSRLAVGDGHRLDRLAVVQPEEELLRAVGGHLPREQLRAAAARSCASSCSRNAAGSVVMAAKSGTGACQR